jgi:hypothetical protein
VADKSFKKAARDVHVLVLEYSIKACIDIRIGYVSRTDWKGQAMAATMTQRREHRWDMGIRWVTRDSGRDAPAIRAAEAEAFLRHRRRAETGAGGALRSARDAVRSVGARHRQTGGRRSAHAQAAARPARTVSAKKNSLRNSLTEGNPRKEPYWLEQIACSSHLPLVGRVIAYG